MLPKSKKILCSICARGGSKGIPSKNTKELSGLPLIAYSIRQAKEANCFDLIAVSSDSEEILTVAQKFGADIVIKRPSDLATDIAGKLPAIIHCAQEVERLTLKEFDIFVDLDATSPLRNSEDILNSIALLLKTDSDNIISGCKARRSPYFNIVEETSSGTVRLSTLTDPPILRRQDAPLCFDMNASIYVWKRECLYNSSSSIFNTKTRLYQMPEERSLDIDTPLDFELVEFLMEKQKKSSV